MWGTKTGREKGMDINTKNTDTKQHLGDVQETALIPLAIRANETERKTARIHDDKAVEIIRELDVDAEKLDQFFSHEGVIARTILFDETVKKTIEKAFLKQGISYLIKVDKVREMKKGHFESRLRYSFQINRLQTEEAKAALAMQDLGEDKIHYLI